MQDMLSRLLTINLSLALTVAGALIFLGSSAYAFNPLANSCTKAPNSDVCQDNSNQNGSDNNPVNDTIKKVANLVALIAGIVAVVVIVLAGISYMMSGGNQQQVASAQRRLLGGVIGLVIVALAWAVASFTINNFVN